MVEKITGVLAAVFISMLSLAHPNAGYPSSSLPVSAGFISTTVTNIPCNGSITATNVPVQYRLVWGYNTNLTGENSVYHQYAAGNRSTRQVDANLPGENNAVSRCITLTTNNLTADFTYSPTNIFAGTSVQFTDISTIGTGTIDGSFWSLDNGFTFSSGQNFVYFFNAPGNYIVLHKVYSSLGEMDTISKMITVRPATNLVANFSYSADTIRVGEAVQFVSTSTLSTGYIMTYNWNFGDGTSSFLNNPVHAFAAAGIYTVSLSITNNFGETDMVIKAVMVYPPSGVQKAELCPAADSTELYCYRSGSVYQWQLSTDSGATYTAINNNSNYSGTTQRWLQLNNIPSSWAGYRYRCLSDGNTDVEYRIVFSNSFTGNTNSAWETPANWSCGNLPDANTDVVIPPGSTVVLNSNASCSTITVSSGASFTISPGYTLTITH